MTDHGARLLVPLVLAAVLLFGCASDTDGAADGPAATAKAAAEGKIPELVFFDSSAFDNDLYEAFSTNARRVEVRAASPFDLNDIPDRLEAWLAAVQESGGEVKATEIPEPGDDQRGIVTEIIDLVVMAVRRAHEEAFYEPAAEYDVWLRYRPDGVVENAVFVRRDSRGTGAGS